MRASLLNTPSYIASAEFPTHVAWEKSGNQNDLIEAQSNKEDNSPVCVRATCAVVGTISSDRLYLEPHGNYNPNFDRAALESSKLQFQIVAPASHPEFKADFELGINHIDSVQNKAISQGPKGEHFVVKDSYQKALRFSSPLFEKRVSPRVLFP
jgi:hypothetical protein